MGIYFCGILDRATFQDCTKFPSFITNVLLQLLRDIINGVCYQRYEKHFEQKKGSANVNVSVEQENVEEELYTSVFDDIVSIHISTLMCFCS